MSDPLWYKDAVFYEVYLRAFTDSNGDGHGDLNGLKSRLDYLKDLGVDCLWLLPIYPSPLKDDGYDIADYYGVHSTYGNLEDVKNLIQAVHAQGMRIIMDLVLNHTSDQHSWFQEARQNRTSPYRDYYVWSDTDQKYTEARIIFLDIEKSNWTWDPVAGQYFWHRFFASQPDLNFDNPAVQAEMLKVMDFWLSLGIDGFRADAVPYLFEREGTNCENLPESHAYLKKIRRHIDEDYPGAILLAEANQWPEDVRPYFGDSDEFNLGFHFPVMPRLYMALRQADRTPIIDILNRTPPIPDDCQWCTFLRNHDELTLEMVTPEERQWMWQEYAPEPRMRLNLGIRRRLAPLLDNDRRKIELLNSLLFSLPGSPIIYYGDEIGMGDNIWLDDRNGVRTPMQWDATPAAGFSQADPDRFYAPLIASPEYGPLRVNVASQQANLASLYHTLRHLLAVRKEHPAFGRGSLEWQLSENKAVVAFTRTYDSRSPFPDRILVVHNLSPDEQTYTLPAGAVNFNAASDLVNGDEIPLPLALTLSPYAYRWIFLH